MKNSVLSKKKPPTLATGPEVSFKKWESAWISLFPEERKMVIIKRTNRYKHDTTNKYSICGEFLWGDKVLQIANNNKRNLF